MIEYYLKKSPHAPMVTIIVKCPRCKNEGKLISGGTRTYGRKLVIKHDTHECNISWTDKCYDELLKIYKEIRGNR